MRSDALWMAPAKAKPLTVCIGTNKGRWIRPPVRRSLTLRPLDGTYQIQRDDARHGKTSWERFRASSAHQLQELVEEIHLPSESIAPGTIKLVAPSCASKWGSAYPSDPKNCGGKVLGRPPFPSLPHQQKRAEFMLRRFHSRWSNRSDKLRWKIESLSRCRKLDDDWFDQNRSSQQRLPESAMQSFERDHTKFQHWTSTFWVT